jgi:predicted DNA-binding transcriptional regulator AlpA
MALAAIVERTPLKDPLLTAEEVAARLNVSKDWVWDHSSRKAPYLPVIRIGDGTLRYRSSQIEEFVAERERLSLLRRKRR